MVMVDGRTIAQKLEARLTGIWPAGAVNLHIVLVGDDPASRQFVSIKRRFGDRVGVGVVVHEYGEMVEQTDLEYLLRRLAEDRRARGVVIQLPLPKQLEADRLLTLIPPSKDVDALGPDAKVLSPVVGAVAEILRVGQVDPAGQEALVVGRGRLVGQPVARWLSSQGAAVKIADEQTGDIVSLLKAAEIIVTGAGRPHFIKPDMISDGVVLIDAATSDPPAGQKGTAGQLAGDADPACAPKCAIFTPVPGGVGPITVAKLFDNLRYLTSG